MGNTRSRPTRSGTRRGSTKVPPAVLSRGTHHDPAWLARGAALLHSQWDLGEWAIEGQRRGEDLAHAAEVLGVASYQTLKNIMVVVRRFPPARRRAGVSYGHHAEVVALPRATATRLLDAACAQHWTRNELRAAAHDASLTGENVRLRARVLELEATLARPATARAYRQDGRATERTCRDGWRQAERRVNEVLAAVAAQVAHPGRDAAHGNAKRALAGRLGEILLAPGDHLQLTPAARAQVEAQLAELRRSPHAAREQARAASVHAETDQARLSGRARPTRVGVRAAS